MLDEIKERFKEDEFGRDDLEWLIEKVEELEVKSKKYDELQSWYWWLERRRHNGLRPVKTFLRGIKRYFDSYEDETGEEKR